MALPGNLAPGTYYIGGIADYNNAVAESNESNNTHDVTSDHRDGAASARSNRVFDHVQQHTIAAGASTTVDSYVVNFGSAPAAASTAGIYLSTDANITTSDTLLATVESSALSPNGVAGYVDHHTVSVALPGNLAPGTYYIGGIADYNNQSPRATRATTPPVRSR